MSCHGDLSCAASVLQTRLTARLRSSLFLTCSVSSHINQKPISFLIGNFHCILYRIFNLNFVPPSCSYETGCLIAFLFRVPPSFSNSAAAQSDVSNVSAERFRIFRAEKTYCVNTGKWYFELEVRENDRIINTEIILMVNLLITNN